EGEGCLYNNSFQSSRKDEVCAVPLANVSKINFIQELKSEKRNIFVLDLRKRNFQILKFFCSFF
ncbi:hypothetical protein, partial [Lactococcus petauri]|uniref:hypothetical protein n=1 Tax=Lactococcus petauri TaxID=1940789 RepID=UPI0028902610